MCYPGLRHCLLMLTGLLLFNCNGFAKVKNYGTKKMFSTGTFCYVSTKKGLDAEGRGSRAAPFKTLAYAVTKVKPRRNNTIYLYPGTYVETSAIVIPVGVNLKGSGMHSTIITSGGALPTPGISQTSGDWKLRFDGSLIQLISPTYNNDTAIRLDTSAKMMGAANGNQTLSGFTIDGNNKQIKAGVWVQNRNNVTMHDVMIKDCKLRGAVFAKGDMRSDVPLPLGDWMHNTNIYNCIFLNSGADLKDESLGDLGLAGLDGADIHHITIHENQGYGIKFIYFGHFRNLKIHDCDITVPQSDPLWGEDISIELWNLSYNNEVYNICCNNWCSFVNQVHFNDYEPTSIHPINLKVHHFRLINLQGISKKESIECALSGVEIYDNYFQDKGLGVAIWGGAGWGGSIKLHDIAIHNNIFVNIKRSPSFDFGNSAGVFIPDPVNDIKIYNNVFDRMGNAIQLNGKGFKISNNVFINSAGDDVAGGTDVAFTNNLKYAAGPEKKQFTGNVSGTGNVHGDPGFRCKGLRWGDYYKPCCTENLVVDKGINVGLPYIGLAPDIGRWELTADRKHTGK